MIQKSYKDLVVWQKAMELVVAVYTITEKFSSQEKYGLISQMWRAAVSIPSNIAEGSRRRGKDIRQFLIIAFASGAELETQIEISKRLMQLPEEEYTIVNSILLEVMKMLNVMINR